MIAASAAPLQTSPRSAGPAARRAVEVFRPGTFTPLSGEPITFSAADVAAMATVYDAALAPAPAVVGHPAIDAPAFAWAAAFRWEPESERLVAELDQIEPAFAEAVAAGRYKRISMALFAPDAPNNPKPGTWYPKHVGFLGAAAPAVPGLKPVAFGDATGVQVFEFGDMTALRDVAGLFRSLREWIIEKFGAEQADRTLPSWTIAWIDDAATPSAPGPAFAAAFPKPEPFPVTTVPTPPPAQPDAAALQARIAELEARERAAAHEAHVAFAERLIDAGRLTPVLQERVVALLDALPADAAPVAFAEGDAQRSLPARQLVRDILEALPPVVAFGQIDTGQRGGLPGRAASFAAPDGMAVDPASAELHAKAVAWQASHPGSDYMAAVAAVTR